MKYRYGLTLCQYEDMWNEQSGKCSICRVSLISPRIDHCHKNNKVRGILCDRCNIVLGSVNDNPRLLRRLAKYLERSLCLSPPPKEGREQRERY
jgi:hypothetical protein